MKKKTKGSPGVNFHFFSFTSKVSYILSPSPLKKTLLFRQYIPKSIGIKFVVDGHTSINHKKQHYEINFVYYSSYPDYRMGYRNICIRRRRVNPHFISDSGYRFNTWVFA